MNTHAVHDSIRLLPSNSAVFHHGLATHGSLSLASSPEAHDCWTEAITSRQWGWRIASSYHAAQEPLPPSLSDQDVRRAYHYLGGNRDDAMAQARSLMRRGTTRTTLQGLLCARDITLEGIASLLGLETEVVRLFESLFFSVRSRETTYVLDQVLPGTRLGAVEEAHRDYTQEDLIMMRTGRDYGWQEVARLAGLSPMEAPNETSETMLADMEKTMAANARMLARSGYLNRQRSPGIQHGKTLMMRPKPAAARNQCDDDVVGIGAFGLRTAVMEHLRRIADPDTQYQLALRRQQAERDLEAAAAKAS